MRVSFTIPTVVFDTSALMQRTDPTALSAKFRIYFLASMRSRTTSATCLILPTRSTTYADRPETLSRSFHGVLRIAASAGSQAISSSRSIVVMHVDMTLAGQLAGFDVRTIGLTR